jgi:hypothetical protein
MNIVRVLGTLVEVERGISAEKLASLMAQQPSAEARVRGALGFASWYHYVASAFHGSTIFVAHDQPKGLSDGCQTSVASTTKLPGARRLAAATWQGTAGVVFWLPTPDGSEPSAVSLPDYFGA